MSATAQTRRRHDVAVALNRSPSSHATAVGTTIWCVRERREYEGAKSARAEPAMPASSSSAWRQAVALSLKCKYAAAALLGDSGKVMQQ